MERKLSICVRLSLCVLGLLPQPALIVLTSETPTMGKKAAKSTRKFAASGQLKKTIQARRKHRDIKKKVEKRQAAKGKGKQVPEDSDVSDEEDGGVQEASGKYVVVAFIEDCRRGPECDELQVEEYVGG